MDLVSLEWHLVQFNELKDREGLDPTIGVGWGDTEVSNFEFSPIECKFEPEFLVNFQIWSVTFIFHFFSSVSCLPRLFRYF